MAKSPNWSVEETNNLIKYYPIHGANDSILEFIPSRNKKAIGIKASRLGLKVLNPWNKVKSTEEYVLSIDNLGITVLGTYTNDATKILHRCALCETEWYSKPNNIINGSGCPPCNKGFGSKYTNDSNPLKAFLYVLHIVTIKDEFIKIGVSCQHTDKRIYEIKSAIGKENIILCNIVYRYESTGKVILDLESEILYNRLLQKHISYFDFKGKTELFKITELPIILNNIERTINGN